MIARYHCEKLNDYVIKSLAHKLGDSTFFFFRQNELFTIARWVVHRLMQGSDIYIDNYMLQKKENPDCEACSLNREN